MVLKLELYWPLMRMQQNIYDFEIGLLLPSHHDAIKIYMILKLDFYCPLTMMQ